VHEIFLSSEEPKPTQGSIQASYAMSNAGTLRVKQPVCVKLTTHSHLMPSLRMNGPTLLLPHFRHMQGDNFTLFVIYKSNSQVRQISGTAIIFTKIRNQAS
jgi:hypothetical protein